MRINEIFMSMWNGLKEIAFKEEWSDGIDYLNGACAETPTTAVRFTDNDERKGILIPVDDGALVVFQRYSHGEAGTIVSNSRPELFSGELKESDLDVVRKAISGKMTEDEVRKYVNERLSYLEEDSYKEANRTRITNRFRYLGLIK